MKMKIKILRLCFAILLLCNQLIIAQDRPEFGIVTDGDKYSLINNWSFKTLFKNCAKIEALKLNSAEPATDYYLLITEKKIDLFSVRTKNIIWTQKIKDSNQCFEFKEIKKQNIAILLIFSTEGRKTVLLNAESIIFPKAKSDYTADLVYRENVPGYLIVEQFIKAKGDEIYYEGLISFTGDEVLPLMYKTIKDYDEINNLFIVSNEEQSAMTYIYGAVDKANKIVIPFKYTVLDKADGYYVALNNMAGIISPTDTIVPFSFTLNTEYGKLPYYKNGVFNFLFEAQPISFDTSKVTLQKINNYLKTYKSADYYNENYREVIGEKKFSDENDIVYIKNIKTNEVVISKDYIFGTSSHENPRIYKGGVGVAKEGKWGMINIETGKLMIPFEYEIPYLTGTNDMGYRYKDNAYEVKHIVKDLKAIDDTTVFLILKRNGRFGLVDLT